MKTIKIKHDHFVKSVNLLDKIVGNVEPINRRVYFYTREDVLVAHASDGCVNIFIALGRMENFNDFYVAPLDNIKLLSKSGNDDVEIRFSSKLEFLMGPEYISVLHPFSRSIQRKGRLAAKFELKSKDLAYTLDLGSIILKEGQDVVIGIVKENFFVLSEEHSHIAIAFTKMEGDEFVSTFPYESARHIVKGLNIVGNETMKVGYSDELIGLKFSNVIITFCKSNTQEISVKKIEDLLNIKEKKGLKVEVETIKAGTSLAARFQRKNGGKGYIALSDKIRVGVMSQHSVYEYSKDVMTGLNIRLAVNPQKLNQFLSRLKEKYVEMFFDGKMLFFSSEKAIFAVKTEKTPFKGRF